MGLGGSVLIFFEHMREILTEEYDIRVKNASLKSENPSRNPPKTHLNSYASAFGEFVEIAGIPYLSDSDLGILHGAAKDWASVYQCPRKQVRQIPGTVLEACETYVSDPIRDLPGRLFAWSFSVAVSAGLRWGGLLNTAPDTTVLMKEGLIGFAAKTKTRGGSLKADHGDHVAILSLMKNGCLAGVNCF